MTRPARQAQTSTKLHINRRRLLLLLLILLLLYILLPQLRSFHNSIDVLRHAHGSWVMMAIGCAGMNYICAALVYCALALRCLRFVPTLLVQFASTFANRLLPAGTGAIGVNYTYLRHEQHNVAQATTVVAINNSLGFAGHLLLLAGVLLTSSISLRTVHLSHMSRATIVALMLISGVLTLCLLWFRHARKATSRLISQVVRSVSGYRTHPLRLAAALLFSLMLTTSHVLCLWACAQGLGVSISWVQTFVALSAGVLGITFTPTPGGLIGTEAVITGSLVAFGVSPARALAVTLLYRFITYWLMLLIGAGAFVIAERKHYLG